MVAYGTKDVMTAQVEGTENRRSGSPGRQLGRDRAHYPIANHVLGCARRRWLIQAAPRFADAYVDDVVDWAVGTTHGLKQTSERVAGTRMYQSIAVPLDQSQSRPDHLSGGRVAYQHAGAAALPQACAKWLAVLMRKIWAHAHGRRYRLGLAQGFKTRWSL